MTANEVVELYRKLGDLGIAIWIDGGWGIDALLGRQTRPHDDLDVAIENKNVPQLREFLGAWGFRQIREDSKWNFVLADRDGHEIDVHAFVFDDDGNVVDGIQYPAKSLTGVGTISDHAFLQNMLCSFDALTTHAKRISKTYL